MNGIMGVISHIEKELISIRDKKGQKDAIKLQKCVILCANIRNRLQIEKGE